MATRLIGEKISQTLPSHSKVAFIDSFKPTKKEWLVNYFKCSHHVKMPVRFKTIELRKDHDLFFEINVKCNDCNIGTADSVPSIHIENLVEHNDSPLNLTGVFQRLTKSLIELFTNTCNQHEASPDPLRAFTENHTHLLYKIYSTSESIIMQTVNSIANVQNHPPDTRSQTPQSSIANVQNHPPDTRSQTPQSSIANVQNHPPVTRSQTPQSSIANVQNHPPDTRSQTPQSSLPATVPPTTISSRRQSTRLTAQAQKRIQDQANNVLKRSRKN